ncbi:hypothetical protein C8R43DRAFT_1063146 [Mycena crocata]|nr:hypothetical protein C8R43DRAFT_1063146 [Mycena crocata]
MPATFSPSKLTVKSTTTITPVTSAELFQQTCPNQQEQVAKIWQSCIGGKNGPDATQFKIAPNENGFVNTLMTAYSQHHALIIRPDDVWLAIVSQFCLYINANAELLRANFAEHEGKRELEVHGPFPLGFSALAAQMGGLLDKNVLDPGLREWIQPQFSTTTTNDSTVGAMLAMATMKKFLEYKESYDCGVPRVTLEGERADWELILGRLERLKEYGLEAIAWYHFLVPVISRLVKAFDEPDAATNSQFWQKVATSTNNGSGGAFLSGWITAFCMFSPTGAWLGPKLNPAKASPAPASLTPAQFWSGYTKPPPKKNKAQPLNLDGAKYPKIATGDVASGYAEVDVVVDENGFKLPCVLVAGMVGVGFSSSRDILVSETGRNDIVRPVVGWWMYARRED